MTRFAEGPASSPGFRLWGVSLAWQRTMTAALDPLGLTHVQFVLLACVWWLADHGGAPTQIEVGRQAGTEARMTSEVLRALERRGLVSREVDAADTRARRIAPTAEGSRLARRAIAVVESADAAFFGDAGPDAVALFDRVPPARTPSAE